MNALDVLLRILKYVIMYVPALFGLHTWLYSKSPKYYFFIIRLFSKWRDTTWNVNIEIKLDELGDSYQKLEDVLKFKYKNSKYSRPVNMTNKKMYDVDIFKVLVQDDFQDGQFSRNIMFVSISQLNVTLNNAEEKLRELRELFNDIERALRPRAVSYNLDVHFSKGKNPFYGLMVQRLGKNNITHFECFFPISAIVPRTKDGGPGSNNQVRVFKEKLTINETSFDIVEETARRALLFK
ncbi:hypothetical protein E6C60_2593 [Paenibacillus algicola]|uniref:Uncharacterized protein n=1 Tax=Paenibacillus algicola TaxID=2565926 RepID=A0A4P8XLW4_9BACL|nr:hypothetical protein [Paenibacillus algicola]QCT03305.1 hypothetical protein E6C60_2593 [Paenibacillus algicola]